MDLAKHERLLLELPSLIELKDIAPDGRVLIDARNHRLPVVGRTAGMERERDLSWLDVTVLGDISRDGKQILLAEEDAPMVTDPFWVGTRALDGSEVVRLGSGLGGRFSADGKWATAFTPAHPLKYGLSLFRWVNRRPSRRQGSSGCSEITWDFFPTANGSG